MQHVRSQARLDEEGVPLGRVDRAVAVRVGRIELPVKLRFLLGGERLRVERAGAVRVAAEDAGAGAGGAAARRVGRHIEPRPPRCDAAPAAMAITRAEPDLEGAEQPEPEPEEPEPEQEPEPDHRQLPPPRAPAHRATS